MLRAVCMVHIGVTDVEYLLTRYAQLLEHRVHRVRIGFRDGLRRLSDAQLHRISEKSVDERTGNGVGFIRQNGVLDAAAVQLCKRFTHPCIRLGEIGEIAEVCGAVVIAYRGLKCGNPIRRQPPSFSSLW